MARRCRRPPRDGERRLFSGSERDIVGDIHALRDLGVTAIDFDFERPEADAVIAEMRDSGIGCWQRFRDDLMR